MRANLFALPFAALLSLIGLIPSPGQSDKPTVADTQPPSVAAPTADPEIIGDASYPYLAEFKVRNVPTGTAVIWNVTPDDTLTAKRVIKSEKACLIAGPPRAYKVKVWLVKGEDSSELEKSFVLTGGTLPNPPNPIDPVVPPGPGTAPIPVPGFRAMFIYQDKDQTQFSTNQLSILYGGKVRKYLEDKAVVGSDGKTKEYRIWDVDVKGTENESKLWQDAFKRPRQLTTTVTVVDPATGMMTPKVVPVPWAIISNGKEGWEGPILPTTTPDDFLTLLKKYGG
jgi:hypothetical protein